MQSRLHAGGLRDLLGHAGWLRRLAVSLLRDSDAADDVVQETLVAAWAHPPGGQGGGDGQAGIRPWLARVARNQARDQRRSEGRRRAREAAVAAGNAKAFAAAPATPEQLIGDLEIHRLLAEVVTALAEPYRSTLVLHYYEAIPAAEIAHRLGIPASTVRWRLQEGLGRVRVALDRRHGGERARWQRALAPLVAARGWPAETDADAEAPASSHPAAAAVSRVVSPHAPHALAVWAGLGALVMALGVVFWYRVGADGGVRVLAERAPSASPGLSPSSPPVPKRRVPPRFASHTATTTAAAGDTAEQRQASDILHRMLTAILSDDYDGFLADAGDQFKVASTPRSWREVRAELGALRGGFEATPVGNLRRTGGVVEFLFKLELHDGSDDQILRLALANGRVEGFAR